MSPLPEPVVGRPRISVGVPVYNGAQYLARALDSVLAQDFTDFEVIISDNASTDQTAAIAQRYAVTDPRIRYYRQPTNLGALGNFAFVANEAVGDYFIWAAVDDVRSNDFLRVNYEFLSAHPEYSASVSATYFEEQSADAPAVGDDLLGDADLTQRIVRFLDTSHANSSFYSLFRRGPLIDALTPIAWYLGADWTIMLRVAATGPMARLEAGWCSRGGRGLSTNYDYVLNSTRIRRINWILPFYDFSLAALSCARSLSLRSRIAIARQLLRLNYNAFQAQILHTLRKRRPQLARRTST